MRIHETRAAMAAVLAIGAMATFSITVQAQVSTASIQGTVRDSSGAAIPAAAIVLHNNSNNVNTNTATNGAGEYAIVNILPGSYNLRISKAGFQSAQQNDVILSVNQTAAYDFPLPVGSAEQPVTVTAAAPTIESSTAELGAGIDTASVNDLPLNGRTFTQLLHLTPGASPI